MKYLLQWGESPEYNYENTFETIQDALYFVNHFNVQWNSTAFGHWFELYEKKDLICDSMWEDMRVELERLQ